MIECFLPCSIVAAELFLNLVYLDIFIAKATHPCLKMRLSCVEASIRIVQTVKMVSKMRLDFQQFAHRIASKLIRT